MDAAPISFTGRLTEQDAVDLHRYLSLCKVRPSIRWLIAVVFGLLAAAMIASLVLVGMNSPGFLFLVVWVAVPSGWWFHDRFAARSQYRRHPEFYEESTVTITAADVALSSANIGIRLKWSRFSFLLDTPKGILFMVHPMQPLCWLPQRLFEANDDKTAIVAYASENNIPIKSMK